MIIFGIPMSLFRHSDTASNNTQDLIQLPKGGFSMVVGSRVRGLMSTCEASVNVGIGVVERLAIGVFATLRL
jgi:hypothetical protein